MSHFVPSGNTFLACWGFHPSSSNSNYDFSASVNTLMNVTSSHFTSAVLTSSVGIHGGMMYVTSLLNLPLE